MTRNRVASSGNMGRPRDQGRHYGVVSGAGFPSCARCGCGSQAFHEERLRCGSVGLACGFHCGAEVPEGAGMNAEFQGGFHAASFVSGCAHGSKTSSAFHLSDKRRAVALTSVTLSHIQPSGNPMSPSAMSGVNRPSGYPNALAGFRCFCLGGAV